MFPPYPKRSMKMIIDSLYRINDDDWIAQNKFNGINSVIEIKNKRVLNLWNRHGKVISPEKFNFSGLQECVNSLNLKEQDVVFLNGEFLHNKIKNQKNSIVLYDILYYNKPLLSDYPERLKLLTDLIQDVRTPEFQIRLIESYYDSFIDRYYEAIQDEDIEGLVLKRKTNSKLRMGNFHYEVDWIMRVRKPKEKVYGF